MEVIFLSIETIILQVLYARISGIRLAWYNYFIGLVAYLSFTGTLGFLLNGTFLEYLILPGFFLLYSFVRSRFLTKHLSIFYGLFPIVLWNLLHRLINFLVLPVFGFQYEKITENSFLLIISSFLASILSLFLPNILKYDFKRLREFKLNNEEKNVIKFLNFSMFLYFIFIQLFSYFEISLKINTMAFRELLVVVYIILFLISVNILDRNLRKRIQEKLNNQRELQLKNMSDYSRHIEELYNELRSFRHDYINILRSLRLGIENRDLSTIERVYNDVLKDSGQPLNQPKFDLGRLTSIHNDALKSLLSAKFIEAESKQIAVSLEVSGMIEPQGMELLDLLTLVSVLTDNAIEAAIHAECPTVSIAYLEQGDKQIFMIENSTKESFVDTSQIFERGVSSKGQDRGIGLANVQSIVSRYRNVSLQTVSQDHLFQQELRISHD
ncbi:sensor histidine kinase [Streptococcus panodentis]|uniref:Sensor histidine kinase n=2 Tax=Streptococcus panodentis TaxID=1581472 RepID=A0ABS5AUV9_9STRE|nr:sensor histidine kinase [Streptococcus panodentis]